MSEEKQALEAPIPQSLDALASLLENREHLLALDGDDAIAKGALSATKDIFDHGELSHSPLPLTS